MGFGSTPGMNTAFGSAQKCEDCLRKYSQMLKMGFGRTHKGLRLALEVLHGILTAFGNAPKGETWL